MLDIENINHVGFRIRSASRTIAFYKLLGFQLIKNHGFDEGHPIVMKHSCGILLNFLGPAKGEGHESYNILMDNEEKHAGITHLALTVRSLKKTKSFLAENGIPITGSFEIKDMSAIFIRDPDGHVIELDGFHRHE